jgi:MFS family permease
LSPERAAGAEGPRTSAPPPADATALLCLFVFGNTFAVGAFAPLVPDIARAHELTDRQVGAVAAAFGFARMVGAMPAGALAGRRLGLAMAAAPAPPGVGVLALASATGFATGSRTSRVRYRILGSSPL